MAVTVHTTQVPQARRRPAAAVLGRVTSLPPYAREIAIAIAAYLIYQAARVVAAGDYATAMTHAHDIVALERGLHLDVEGGVQRAFLDSPLLHILNYVYVAAQNLVLPASLVLVYRLNRSVYRVLRNTLLATWLLALPVYALYPAAPPRLSGMGIVDTVSTGSPLKLESGTTTSLFNQFAAVPSLHVGFAFAIGIALAAALRNPIAARRAARGGRSWSSPWSPPATTSSSTRSRGWPSPPPATACTASSRPAGPRCAPPPCTRSATAGRSSRRWPPPERPRWGPIGHTGPMRSARWSLRNIGEMRGAKASSRWLRLHERGVDEVDLAPVRLEGDAGGLEVLPQAAQVRVDRVDLRGRRCRPP